MHAAALLIVTFLVATGAGASKIKVDTEPSVNATHGETVTLSCSIKENDEVHKYQWSVGQQVLCNFTEMKSEVSAHFQCNYTDSNALVLTIKDAQRENSGTYICTVLIKSGHGKNKTELHVSEKKFADETVVISGQQHGTRQEPNQTCISESKWINLLGSLLLLMLILESGR